MSDPYGDFDYDYDIDYVEDYDDWNYGLPYDRDDDDDEPEEWSQYHYLYKAENGQLSYGIVTLSRYRGQDWGQCEVAETWYNVRTLLDEYFAFAVEQGKSMKPGETVDFYPWEDDEEEDDEDDSPTIPTTVDEIPF